MRDKKEELIKRADKKTQGKLSVDMPGSVYRTYQELTAERKLIDLADRVRKEGLS